jgi:hypothetical protein
VSALSSASVSWLVGQAIIWFLAAVGGAIVLRGLWLEYKGGKDGYFHAQKKKVERGEIWVILGVFVEIVVGVIFAARDGCQARQTAIEIANNDPRNQPLMSVVAFATIRYKTNDVIWSNSWMDAPHFWAARSNEPALLSIFSGKMTVTMDSPPKTVGGGIQLISDIPPSFGSFGGTNSNFPDGLFGSFRLAWQPATREMLNEANRALHWTNNSAGLIADSIENVSLELPFLRYKTHVVGGSVDLIFNSSMKREFLIPSQWTFNNPKITAWSVMPSNITLLDNPDFMGYNGCK